MSNLHRQVVHTEDNVGIPKTASIRKELLRRNSGLNCIAHNELLTSDNALQLISLYDVIVDASDNVATRYLVNDACVMLKKPLISGSALKWEGQVTVYNYNSGPCYRCLFPTPPPAETVTRCSDGGVIGTVTGIIGCVQAMEAIKVASRVGETLSGRLLLYDGLYGTFRTVKLRPKQPNCEICSENPKMTHLIDYPQFCGAPYSDKAEKIETSIDPTLVVDSKEYEKVFRNREKSHILLDVREEVQFNICALPNAWNIPLDNLEKRIDDVRAQSQDNLVPVYVVCRRGWDSQTAVEMLCEKGLKNIYHIEGGLVSWTAHIDPTFPTY